MSGTKYENQQMSNSTYEVHHKKDKDFKTVEMHSHDFSEIYFFLQGSASYIVEDCKYSLRPGDVLLIPPNKLHQLDIKDSAMTYERFVVWLNQRYLKRISTSKTDLNTCFCRRTITTLFLSATVRFRTKFAIFWTVFPFHKPATSARTSKTRSA